MRVFIGSARLFTAGRIHTAAALRRERAALARRPAEIKEKIAALERELDRVPETLAAMDREIEEFESKFNINWR